MTAAAAEPYEISTPASTAGPSRHERLVAAASRIRVRPGLDLPVERILLVAASVLFPLGLVLVFLGWDGAAHTGRTYAQIDYLISGGLLGLGLSVAGGFMYFGYWLSRQLGESRRQSALTLQALGRLEELLDASLNSSLAPAGSAPGAAGLSAAAPGTAFPVDAEPPPAVTNGSARRSGGRRRPADTPTGEVPALGPRSATPPPGGRAATPPTGLGAPTLLATPRGTLLHRPECPVVAHRHDLRQVPAGTDGYGYCSMCDAAAALV